jgi:hypothetical protein
MKNPKDFDLQDVLAILKQSGFVLDDCVAAKFRTVVFVNGAITNLVFDLTYKSDASEEPQLETGSVYVTLNKDGTWCADF